MNTILPSPEWISKVEQSEKDYMKDRMEAIRNRQGNPEGIEMRCYGNALCLYSQTMPWPAFNTVKGFSSADVEYLDEILDFYRSRQRKVQFEIVPSRVDQQTLSVLSERGLYASGFHTSMYGIPVAEWMERVDRMERDMERENENHMVAGRRPVPDHVQIKEVGEEDFVAYATVHCRGTGLPDSGIPHVAENNRVLWRRPGWKFYMAFVSGEPAAAGVMYIHNRICSLTFAATLPEYRNRGLHRLLLKTRILESARQNCELVVGQCAFLSQSHRNMESVGLRVAYVRTTWTER
jgi:hypothetical protein